jgi:hypothetical protein
VVVAEVACEVAVAFLVDVEDSHPEEDIVEDTEVGDGDSRHTKGLELVWKAYDKDAWQGKG